MNLLQIFKAFPKEEDCVEFLEKKRWSNGIVCPYCQSGVTHKNGGRNQCNKCFRSFSVTTGTFMHHTHLDLRYWLYIISLMLNAKKGISAYQVARDLNANRPTVWKIMHKVRKIMATDPEQLKPLAGIFEMDETYVNAKKDDEEDNNKFGGGRSTKNNTPVVAIKNRDGNLSAFVTSNTKYYTLGRIALNVAEKGSEVQTDEYSSYKPFKMFFKHRTVNHSIEYVTADKVHCNSIEGFWSLLKRGIKGNFHWVSKKYLGSYVSEFEYKYNNADNPQAFDDLLHKALSTRGWFVDRYELFV